MAHNVGARGVLDDDEQFLRIDDDDHELFLRNYWRKRDVWPHVHPGPRGLLLWVSQ